MDWIHICFHQSIEETNPLSYWNIFAFYFISLIINVFTITILVSFLLATNYLVTLFCYVVLMFLVFNNNFSYLFTLVVLFCFGQEKWQEWDRDLICVKWQVKTFYQNIWRRWFLSQVSMKDVLREGGMVYCLLSILFPEWQLCCKKILKCA